MATYIPGVKDYIPKLQPFTPNYKFLQDVLQVRQDRYTNNFKALNNLYNQVVNADLSIEENRNTRDQYANNLSEKLKQVSGKDLSLQGNVEQAKALFKPFYEDDQLLYEVTRNLISLEMKYKNQQSRRGIYKEIDKTIAQGFFDNAEDAKSWKKRQLMIKESKAGELLKIMEESDS